MESNQTVTCARAGSAPVEYLQWVIAYTAVQFAFYGLNAVCFLTSAYCLISRGVCGSRPRLGLLAATTIMFIGSTVSVVLDTIQSMYGARDAFGTLQEHDCTHLTHLSIAQNVVLRMMFMLSDVIVVWRAWVLWSANRIVRRCLIVCLTLTCSCLLADAAVVAWEQAVSYYANSALFSLLVTLPILVTNVTVTTTIGVRAIAHYRAMRSNIGSREYGQKVMRALLVLLWSGAAYCALCFVFFASGVTSNHGRRWGEFVGAIGASVSCTYPTLIIIWAALERDSDTEVQLNVMQSHGVQMPPRDDSGPPVIPMAGFGHKANSDWPQDPLRHWGSMWLKAGWLNPRRQARQPQARADAGPPPQAQTTQPATQAQAAAPQFTPFPGPKELRDMGIKLPGEEEQAPTTPVDPPPRTTPYLSEAELRAEGHGSVLCPPAPNHRGAAPRRPILKNNSQAAPKKQPDLRPNFPPKGHITTTYYHSPLAAKPRYRDPTPYPGTKPLPGNIHMHAPPRVAHRPQQPFVPFVPPMPARSEKSSVHTTDTMAIDTVVIITETMVIMARKGQDAMFMKHKPYLAEHIRSCSSAPLRALIEARRFEPEKRRDWEEKKVEKMEKALWYKFTQHLDLWQELVNTGDAELVENSPYDWFWGIGQDGKGRNELGKALMRLRKELVGYPATEGLRPDG
ncbi:hypothetical protein FB107DRAFT_275763 [Schizophyllum commune]